MNATNSARQKQKGSKRLLATLLASAVLTFAAIPACSEIVNSVTVTATRNGTPLTVTAVEEVDVIDQTPGITLEKTGVFNDANANGVADVGETVNYSFAVTNTGNATLVNVILSDNKVAATPFTLTGADDVAPVGDSTDSATLGWASLAPGDTLRATASYVLVQGDIDAGTVVNDALVSSATMPGVSVTATDQATTPLTSASSIALEKSGTLNLVDGIADVGDIITYQFQVTNTGPTTLTNVSVTDPMLQVASLSGASELQNLVQLANLPFDPITTASIDAATLIGPEAREPAQWKIAPPALPASLHAERKLLRLTSDDAPLKEGDRIGIYLSLTNTGNVPLTTIRALQPGSEVFGDGLDILAPNTTDASSVLFTHVLTEEDITTGQVDVVTGVTAKARGVPLVQTLRGPMSLLDVQEPDALATASITPANVATLAPGAQTTFSATYQLTQVDIDAGQVLNTATASGTNTLNGTVTATDNATIAVPQTPGIAVEKTGALALGPDNKASVGDLITYTFTVSNIGNTTLDNIQLSDPKPGINITFTPFNDFEPGDSRDFTGTYALTQADIDQGEVDNQARVSGRSPTGNRVTGRSNDPATTEPEDPTVVNIPLEPAVALIKNAPTLADTNGNGIADTGDTLTWTFAVHNTGNAQLTGVTVTDRNSNVVVAPSAPTNITLAAGQIDTTSFTATYVLTDADILARRVENTADVTAEAPDDSTTGDVSDPSSITSDGPTVYDIPPTPALAVLKPQPSVVDTNGNAMNDVGDVLNYSISVINTGNVPLTNVVVTDPKANNFTITLPSILPGLTNAITVPVSYTITAADLVVGQVENIAFAEAVFGGNTVGDQSDTDNITEDDPTITPITPRPAVALVKPQPDIIDADGNGVTNEGDQLVYTFRVTNTGNVSLSNVTITDALGTVVSTRTTALEAGDTDDTSFTMTYTLVAADIARGTITNSAEVVGLSPTSIPARDTSDDDSILQDDPTVTPLSNLMAPEIALLKQAAVTDVNGNGIADLGDRITYTFSVTNTGNVDLTNVAVTDAKLATEGVALQPANGFIGNLARGATISGITATRIVTQADVDAGSYDNQATVAGSFGTRTVTDLSDDDALTGNDRTVVNLARNPAVAIIKALPVNNDRNGNGLVDAGDELTYTFEIHNTGNVTLFDVAVTDSNADRVIGGPLASLPPGAVDRSISATRLITDADGIAGEIINSATVNAAESAGSPPAVTDISDVASLAGRNPTIMPVVNIKPVFTKTAARSTIRRGERVEYTIAAKNLGVGPYDVADIMPPGFAFVPGSASVNGAAVTPVQSGKTLTFANIVPNAARSVTVKLSLRASASTAMQTGEFINRARLFLNGTGQLLADAQARVTIKEEAVFDCGEIVGRVFDDINSNGYMDDGEAGLPGVRVVTVKGLLVTTDKHGRFHVTCADVPNAQIGSNFLMKLDPRTLPAGYALTTENPRDVRLTRGKVTKLNFGASKRRDVGLDLTKDAFGKGLDLKPKFATGLDRLVSLLRQGKGKLTITYRCGVYAPIADERLSAVEEIVQAKWKQEGGNKPLKITTRVECGK